MLAQISDLLSLTNICVSSLLQAFSWQTLPHPVKERPTVPKSAHLKLAKVVRHRCWQRLQHQCPALSPPTHTQHKSHSLYTSRALDICSTQTTSPSALTVTGRGSLACNLRPPAGKLSGGQKQSGHQGGFRCCICRVVQYSYPVSCSVSCWGFFQVVQGCQQQPLPCLRQTTLGVSIQPLLRLCCHH